MAVLDFPAAPTMGQVVTLTNGFSYQWDGAVWTLTPASPGQAAGGDLTGTYPNPTIATGAVTLAKLAPRVTVRQIVSVALTANTLVNTSGTWADVKTLSMTTTGGMVVLFAMAAWYGQAPVNAAIYVSTGLARDQVIPNLLALNHQINIQGSGLAGVPLPPIIMIDDSVTAGAHVYHLVAGTPNTNIYVATAATFPGTFWAAELA
jgi:hypothetical protein